MSRSEFQAVVLAGGQGVRLYPLTSDHSPKALLPIANKPMIHYCLTYLEKNGFKEVILVITNSQAREIRLYIEEVYKGKLNIQLKVLDTKENKDNIDSAQALREIQHLITTDFIVMSADLITDVPLLNIADIHRQNNSSITMLLKEETNIEDEEKDYFGLLNYEKKEEESSLEVSQLQKRKLLKKKPTRVIKYQNLDIEQQHFPLNRNFLKRWTHFTLSKQLVDSHLYICSKWVLDVLIKKPEMYSIKHDLIPYLVENQKIQKDKLDSILNEVVPPFQQDAAYRMSTTESNPDDLIRVYSYIVPEDKTSTSTTTTKNLQKQQGVFCKRCLTIGSYLFVNRELAKRNNISLYEDTTTTTSIHQSPNVVGKKDTSIDSSNLLIGPDCNVGESIQLTGNAISSKKQRPTTLKKSNIGNHCKIGQSSKIENSVVMDHVTIGDNVVISNSIICSNAHINSNAKLTGCKVGSGKVVEEGDYKDETFAGGEMEL
ncbi:hypothetical protein ABK040_006339 [Willaertia magna]